MPSGRQSYRYVRTALCPECGGTYSPQGLAGHLMFQHNKEPHVDRSEKKGKTGAEATGQGESKAAATLRLIEQLKQVKTQRAELTANRSDFDDWLWDAPAADPVAEECCAALNARELELFNELRALEGKPPLQRVTETGFLGLSSRVVLREVPAEKPEPAMAAADQE